MYTCWSICVTGEELQRCSSTRAAVPELGKDSALCLPMAVPLFTLRVAFPAFLPDFDSVFVSSASKY